MSENLEQVAIAIHAKLPGIEFNHEMARRLARAAIEAMREPTEAMVEAGRAPYPDRDPSEIWPDMIDEALK